MIATFKSFIKIMCVFLADTSALNPIQYALIAATIVVGANAASVSSPDTWTTVATAAAGPPQLAASFISIPTPSTGWPIYGERRADSLSALAPTSCSPSNRAVVPFRFAISLFTKLSRSIPYATNRNLLQPQIAHYFGRRKDRTHARPRKPGCGGDSQPDDHRIIDCRRHRRRDRAGRVNSQSIMSSVNCRTPYLGSPCAALTVK